jgi:DNA-binding response OmpR family regulator
MAYKILVADDEPPIVRLIEFILAKEGYEMVAAPNGEDALSRASEQDFDLILLDIMMPRVDGYEVARVLRLNPKYAKIPIIMLSVKAQDEDLKKGLESGVDEYITKPFNPQYLVHMVRGHLERDNA